TMMIGGMAHIAGGVLAAYVGMLGGGDPVEQAYYAKHLLAASIMAAPATLVIAKILIPETGEPLTRGTVRMEVEKTTSNVIDAAAAGAGDGLRLALNIGAMLLAFIALIAMINAPLTWLGEITGLQAAIGRPLDLATIFGWVLAPIAWLIGVPWQDAGVVGSLIGQKVVINEFVAYLQLADIVNGRVDGVALSDQGRLIATYALCGFANFSSIAIQIGGIGGLAPDRRKDLARFGLRAVLGGTGATLMTAALAGVLTHPGARAGERRGRGPPPAPPGWRGWALRRAAAPGRDAHRQLRHRARRQGLQPGHGLRAQRRGNGVHLCDRRGCRWPAGARPGGARRHRPAPRNRRRAHRHRRDPRGPR